MTQRKSEDLPSLPDDLQPAQYGPFPRHTFILNAWLEEKRIEDDSIFWRGHMTHIPSGYRQYVQSAADIVEMLQKYLGDQSA